MLLQYDITVYTCTCKEVAHFVTTKGILKSKEDAIGYLKNPCYTIGWGAASTAGETAAIWVNAPGSKLLTYKAKDMSYYSLS